MNYKSSCSNCSFYRSGICRKKNFKVSVNSVWCNDFSLRLKFRFLNKINTVKIYVGRIF